tara:strand:+ start:8514 stop:8996 length:483 start_codon:yes stop_codon:yes gene_type:complete
MIPQQIKMLADQYALVKASRTILLKYCSNISTDHFYTSQSSFGRGSIHNLLAHISNTYNFWIGEQFLGKTTEYISYTDTTPFNSFNSVFQNIDLLMQSFFDNLESQPPEAFYYEIDGKNGQSTSLEVFTHVITHEYHHKGQLLSLSRELGYTPVDTDILR